jgi:hypothetical protein
MHEFEVGQLTRLTEYLVVQETPHQAAFEMPKLHNDFKQFYTQYDARRGKDFSRAFPQLNDWYSTL